MDPADSYELAMFPLGQVLFPSVVLPLHVFEPRYRAMVEHLVETPPHDPHAAEFGVVLIERGSEVGGGDVRTAVGTVARLIQAEQTDDGRWALVAIGIRRFRLVEWLGDEPWPRARVSDWPDTADTVDPDHYAAVTGDLRRVLALASELGDAAADATADLSDDPGLGSFQLAALGPFGPVDQQKLLAADGVTRRLEEVSAMLAEEHRMLEMRLRLDSETDPPDDFM